MIPAEIFHLLLFFFFGIILDMAIALQLKSTLSFTKPCHFKLLISGSYSSRGRGTYCWQVLAMCLGLVTPGGVSLFQSCSRGGLTIVCVVPSTWSPAVHCFYKIMLKAHGVAYKYQPRNQNVRKSVPPRKCKCSCPPVAEGGNAVSLVDIS